MGSEYVGVTRPILNTVDPVWNAGSGNVRFPIFSGQVEEEEERIGMFALFSPKKKKKILKKTKGKDIDDGGKSEETVLLPRWRVER